MPPWMTNEHTHIQSKIREEEKGKEERKKGNNKNKTGSGTIVDALEMPREWCDEICCFYMLNDCISRKQP